MPLFLLAGAAILGGAVLVAANIAKDAKPQITTQVYHSLGLSPQEKAAKEAAAAQKKAEREAAVAQKKAERIAAREARRAGKKPVNLSQIFSPENVQQGATAYGNITEAVRAQKAADAAQGGSAPLAPEAKGLFSGLLAPKPTPAAAPVATASPTVSVSGVPSPTALRQHRQLAHTRAASPALPAQLTGWELRQRALRHKRGLYS